LRSSTAPSPKITGGVYRTVTSRHQSASPTPQTRPVTRSRLRHTYPAMARKPDVDAAVLAALVRRAFGTSVPVRCERTPEGVSTQVYRLVRGPEPFYLRVAEEPDENLETDAELHQRLLALGVRVPRVVFVEAFDATIGRSVAITTEVPGASLAAAACRPAVARAVAEAAGEDLGMINRLTVDGFGWVRRRGPGWPLRAEHASYLAFLTSYLPASWPGPLGSLLSGSVLAAVEAMLDAERARSLTAGRLAHGDFDTTAIYCAGGRYTGLIDFGEIRGAEPAFDLGHFHLHDRKRVPVPLLPALLDGYGRVTPPPDERSIRRSAVLLGLRQLCRWLARGYGLDHPAVVQRAARLRELVDRD
jgi:aminoglycoside phosphotransferase (APT) family kinase protein